MAPARRRWFAAFVAIIVAASPVASSAWAAGECRPPESLTSFGTWFDQDLELTATDPDRMVNAVTWVSDAKTMRLLLQVRGGADRRWHLLVRDESYHVLATFYPEDFAAADGTGSTSRWTGRLPVANAHVDLRADPASDIRVAVVAGIAMPAVAAGERQYSTQHNTPIWRDLFDPRSPILARRAGDAVGMILGGSFDPDNGQHATWCCTGVMVGQSLMLTNWHCGGAEGTRPESYWNADTCANTLFDLGWDSGTVSQQYACSEVVAKDRTLDFALLRIRPVIGAGSGSPHAAFAPIAPGPLPDSVFLIHHALCQPKLLSDRCHILAGSYPNWVDPARNTEFTHDCDTEPGASGAPVFDAAGRLVGLHHLGFACAPPDKANKAIPMSEIMEYLAANAPAVAAELQQR